MIYFGTMKWWPSGKASGVEKPHFTVILKLNMYYMMTDFHSVASIFQLSSGNWKNIYFIFILFPKLLALFSVHFVWSADLPEDISTCNKKQNNFKPYG